MQRSVTQEQVFLGTNGEILFKEGTATVDLIESGNIPENETIHYGPMPDSVKAVLRDPMPLFLRSQ